ncbi:MAG: leucine-rich repeat protein [Clostridiales bacterium]|nr:leucine-rich repeat protein [Clostridiales bacterium]
MSKKSSVNKSKKSGRRLKRSVRRTLAAVLMITAIGVAAIPVPENLAADGDDTEQGDNTGNTTTESIGDVHDMSKFGYEEHIYETNSDGTLKTDANGNYIINKNNDIKITSGTYFPLDLYAGETTDTLLTHLKDSDAKDDGQHKTGDKPDVYASYTIRDISGAPTLIWEFLYYLGIEGGTIRGVVCKYNEGFATNVVDLESHPITSYYTLTTDKFDSLYDSTNASHLDTVKEHKIDPTKEIKFTYDDYQKTFGNSKPTGMDQFAWDFLRSEYCAADFKAACDRFEAYYRWDADKNNPNRAPLAAGINNSDFVVLPNDYINTDELKRKFYCENDKTFPGTGFILEPVYDERPVRKDASGNDVAGGRGRIYVARGTDSSTPDSMYRKDKNNYLVLSESDYSMGAIGAKAFAGVQNVINMTIPTMINYIGDEAFLEAGLIESIDIANVKQIGNRAFKNCYHLSKVVMGEGVNDIGQECFANTAISTIALPSSISEIGSGAFANCSDMTAVDFSKLSGCIIDDYAFFNCTALREVDMSNAGITQIRNAAFAADSGVLEKFTFPQRDNLMNAKDSIGDYLFAGRSSLKTVIFPKSYGSNARISTKLPDNMFHGCINLEYVEFPANYVSAPNACAFVNYDPEKLFRDVRGSKLYVRGPAEHNGAPDSDGDITAYPRKCTWDALTADNGYKVPYLYMDSSGKEYYEVSDGKYLLCIQKNADGQTGTLVSCKFKPRSAERNINLTIPAMVGDTKVTAIASNCFSDKKLNGEVVSLTIEDESVSTIADSVFKGWPKLAKVYIGNSITSIGREAFADCNNLVDVTFNSPLNNNHAGFTIGTDAFKTGSSRLTFHGDIVEGYAPFEWATDPNNIIKQPEGIRVCYKSLTPTYLTVMYNPNTELVTLLDYPKYNQVSDVLNEVHEREFYDSDGKRIYNSYEDMMEQRSYADYSDGYYDGNRTAFANAWKNALTPADREALYESDDYGPWINPDFCNPKSDLYWEKKWVTSSSGGGNTENTDPDNTSSGSTGTDPDNTSGGSTENSGENNGGEGDGSDVSAINKLADWLFEPIVAYAADVDPVPYYSRSGNEYDVVKYSEMTNRKPWQTTTSEADALINATKTIVVPAGVDSIDVYGYYNNLDIDGNELEVKAADNLENAKQYLTGAYGCWDTDTIKMYTLESVKDEDNINSVPGLFSGNYDDKAGEGKEERTRGNDRIISVTLNSVKYLPDYAFDSCEQLTSVILGPDCADIGTAPFRGCHSLKAVGDNDYYKTNNGIVYSVNPDGSYTIEECLWARGLAGGVGEAQVSLSTDENLGMVSTIKDGAFEDCDNITLVDLTNTAGLVDIPDRCFKNCDNLNRIWLPGTVNSIGEEAFAGANQLSELQIPGKEVFISGNAFDTNKLATTSVYTSEDSSAKRYVDTYGRQYKLEWHKKDNWRVIFLDADLQQIGKEQVVDDGAYAEIPEDPVKEDWVFDKWLGTNNADPKNPIHADTTFVATGYSTSSMVDGKYTVDFMDQVDGTIFSTQLVEPGGDAIIPQAPTHAGYTFLRYGGDSLTNIQKNSIALAMYSGGTGTGVNGGNGTTSGSSSSTQTSSNSSSSGSSTSSSTSDGARSVSKYTVTVINGSGSGTYDAGSTVIIAANTPATGKVFKNWTTESPGVTFASVSLSATTFIMPDNNVTVTANYVTGSSNTLTGVSTNGNTGNNSNNGNTRVDITKPGISNKDLATAKVNGSTDNFVVKISETPEATQAVMNALTNKYGNLDSVLYYAMDISLYDSTGTVKISDTTGLTVDITIPIPDALTVFGGNNMAGAVVANDQLEDLSERFSTINGVPCISFTATHFSPYTVYVNTQQLSDGALDITPKTGDPIHPKWFLSLGLACMSVILFMKKDKKPVKVRAQK